MAGRVWTQLRRPLRAVPILERATAGYGDDTGRETALYLTWLAESLLQANEIERAAVAAARALRLARRAGSVRAAARVGLVRQQLARFRGNTAVDAFEDEACGMAEDLEQSRHPEDAVARWQAYGRDAGVAAGVRHPTVQKLLGHRDARTTQRYTHTADEVVRKVTESMSSAMFAKIKRADTRKSTLLILRVSKMAADPGYLTPGQRPSAVGAA